MKLDRVEVSTKVKDTITKRIYVSDDKHDDKVTPLAIIVGICSFVVMYIIGMIVVLGTVI